MARITVEDCLQKVDNRFGLIHLAAKRVRQLRKGADPLEVCKNKDIVVALREIAAGKVYQHFPGEETPALDEKVPAPAEALPEHAAEEGNAPEEQAADEKDSTEK